MLVLKQRPISNTLTSREVHRHAKSLPHVESYFCFVSLVPTEWEWSWRLQFTRHICRCCILNWETQAAKKSTVTGTQIEKYTDRLSPPLSRTHTRQVQRCSVLCFVALSRKTLAHISEKRLEISSTCVYLKILSLMWENTRYMTRRRCNTMITDLWNGKKECAFQWRPWCFPVSHT